jgi:hypothetical protein
VDARGVRIFSAGHGIGVLGRDDEALAIGRDQPADDALALATHVHVRSVNEIAPGLDKGVEHRAARGFIARPFCADTEGHRPERKPRDA